MTSQIKRIPDGLVGLCSAVVADDLADIVATDPHCADDIITQTMNTLEDLDRLLNEAGSARGQLIQATVYLSDISLKAEMDKVWRNWIGGEENWPQRACIGVQLSPGYLIEIVVTAQVIKTS